ncbi:hypothetical protein BC629DRAFT_367243 [Irpex lacteus]|nr:hypothetical protein BC629DRAFT_367243 [Irpex lacteus]
MSSTRAFHSTYIPADVVESVIDELRDDGDSLRACALTSRMWVHRSKTHLHRVCVLRHADLRFASKDEAHHYHILNELPSIISYAKELRLQSVSSDRKVTEDDVELNTQFHVFLRQFGHVRKLSIVGMSFVEHPIKHPRVARLNWETLFPAIHTLSLTNGTFAGPQEFLTFVSRFHQLQMAELENIALCRDSSDLKMPSPAPPLATYHVSGFQPRAIRLRKCINDVEMLSMLSRHSASLGGFDTSTLESLHVSTGLSLDACNELASLMTLTRRTLVEVHLTIQEQTELPSFQSNMRPQPPIVSTSVKAFRSYTYPTVLSSLCPCSPCSRPTNVVLLQSGTSIESSFKGLLELRSASLFCM